LWQHWLLTKKEVLQPKEKSDGNSGKYVCAEKNVVIDDTLWNIVVARKNNFSSKLIYQRL